MNCATKRIWLRRLLLLLGVVFIAVSIAGGYYWFYQLAPLRHLVDSGWRKTHSAAAIWAEEQENYHRTNQSPEMFWLGDMIGYYGDKTWTVWLVDNLKNDEAFRFCGCTQTVLNLLTNQPISENKEVWIAWLEKHHGESQEQWIQQGFANRGITVHLPPEKGDWGPLLLLLGNNDKDANGDGKVPGSLKYNAFRWLRDSGFDVADYTADHPDWRSSEQSAMGICNYVRFAGRFPSSDGIGRLAFAEVPAPSEAFVSPLTTPSAKALACAGIVGGIVCGVGLVAISVRMRRSFRAAAG